MKKPLAIAILALGLSPAPALAHHGWGSYDTSKLLTLQAPIDSLVWQNPHVHVMLKYEGVVWEITLGAISTMRLRGVTEDMLKPGTMFSAEGYRSIRRAYEFRAVRFTVAGKTYSMR